MHRNTEMQYEKGSKTGDSVLAYKTSKMVDGQTYNTEII